MPEDNENINPQKDNEQKDEKTNEKPLDINLVKITDDIIKGDPSNQEELKKKIKELKTKITQEINISSRKSINNGLVELDLGLDGLNSTIAQILKIFQGKDWLKEFEQKISVEIPKLVESEIIKIQPSQSQVTKTVKKNLKNESKALRRANKKLHSTKYDLTADIQKLENDSQQVKHLLIALKDFSIDAIKDKSYDKAIEILQNTDEKLLPLIKDQGVLTEDDQKDLKSSVLQELKTALLQKGQIGKAIKIIDTQCSDPACTFSDYFTAQINKSHLLARTGEFNKAIAVLNKLLKKFNSLSPEYREIHESAEIKRALGIVYRSKGSFDDAIKWFNEAKKEYENIEDDIGIHNALWGMGILHYLRGEWEEAIHIWKKIQYFYESKKPTDDLYKSKTLFKLYFDFTRTLQLSGNFKEAETMLNKSLLILDEKKAPSSTYSRAKVYLAFAELYYLQNKIEEAHENIKKVR
ncbi:MAG: tetratricopeptide repeat protein, partial [Candidatus Hodarchaeota archaeon]